MLHPDFLGRPIAHRGLHDLAQGRPENSIEAIDAAVAAGYGIEIDLQLSSDGQAMVFHDYNLNRLTRVEGPLHQHTAAELTSIPLTGGQASIPTLPQVLERVAGRVPLLIEIKDQDGAMGANVGPLEQATARAIDLYEGPVAVMSFNPYAVEAMAEAAPAVPRGIVTSSFDPAVWAPLPASTCAHLRRIPDYDRTGASFISHEAADLGADRVAELKASGAHILCWTVRSAEQEAQARAVAENITFEGFLP